MNNPPIPWNKRTFRVQGRSKTEQGFTVSRRGGCKGALSLIPCLFLRVESFKTGQNPTEVGQAVQEQGGVYIAQGVVQPQCHHPAFRAAADGTGQIQIGGSQRSFLAGARPAFETDVAFLFQYVGLFLQPCYVLRRNTGITLGIVLRQILLQRGKFPHGAHQTSLNAVQHNHRTRIYSGMPHDAYQGIQFIHGSICFYARRRFGAAPAEHQIRFAIVSTLGYHAHTPYPIMPFPACTQKRRHDSRRKSTHTTLQK